MNYNLDIKKLKLNYYKNIEINYYEEIKDFILFLCDYIINNLNEINYYLTVKFNDNMKIKFKFTKKKLIVKIRFSEYYFDPKILSFTYDYIKDYNFGNDIIMQIFKQDSPYFLLKIIQTLRLLNFTSLRIKKGDLGFDNFKIIFRSVYIRNYYEAYDDTIRYFSKLDHTDRYDVSIYKYKKQNFNSYIKMFYNDKINNKINDLYDKVPKDENPWLILNLRILLNSFIYFTISED